MRSTTNTDTFSYDAQELLSQVSYGGGGSSTMVWDAAQQRQKLTNSGGSTYFVYDPTAGVPAVLVETDGENETFYVREPGGELIARATGQTRQYYFFDRLGSTVAMVPAVEGNPTDRLFYTPWGELVTSGSRASTVGTTANPYRYVGQLGYYYHHQDSGLQDWMQLGVRFYEPEIGRFERRDFWPSRATPYSYCHGRPYAAIDPTGMVLDKLPFLGKYLQGQICIGSTCDRNKFFPLEGVGSMPVYGKDAVSLPKPPHTRVWLGCEFGDATCSGADGLVVPGNTDLIIDGIPAPPSPKENWFKIPDLVNCIVDCPSGKSRPHMTCTRGFTPRGWDTDKDGEST